MPAPDPPRMPHTAVVEEYAAVILSESPPLADWHAGRGRAMPRKGWITPLRRAGWPVDTVLVDLPQREHRGVRAGQRTGSAARPITVVPEAWLRLLARRLGVPWPDACRRRVAEG